MADRINDHGKLLVLLIVLAIGTAMIFTGDSDGKLLVVGVFSYVTGNGVLAIRRQAPSPLLSINPPGDLVKVSDLEVLEEAAAKAVAKGAPRATPRASTQARKRAPR